MTITKTWNELEEATCEMLDECYEPFKIGDIEFFPSDIVKRLDPRLFEELVNEYAFALTEDDPEIKIENWNV